ncbi:hypothetical protein [Agrococcus sediminis]|uniref:hypothetical protein n=1 Tax=Agrococcus sediminis TaxID=2599924 RepID=UPI001788A2E0|nr:hypothetical protein [Agrococcus sediminis]
MALAHLLVGLNGAGKSTLARSIAKRDGAVRDWNQWSRARRAQWRDAVLTAGHIPCCTT